MKLLKKALLVSSLVTLNAFALEAVPSRCLVKATKEQKAEIQKLAKEAQEKAKAVKAELAVALKAHRTLLAETNATKEEAQASAEAVKTKTSELASIQGSLRLNVLFDVLSAEQRVVATKCEGRKPVRGHLRHQRRRVGGIPHRGPVARREHHRGPRHHHTRPHGHRGHPRRPEA